MKIFIFTGPTLSAEEGRSVLDAIYLPPASQGDVVNAARARPWAVGIVDGYFQRIPAIWHKEILWAMSRGVHVFGSASMGALRAAELHRFGMEGVGKIFEAFRSGELVDDDEVAVVHGLADTGYRALSEAMVNIRPTLEAAAAAGVIGAATHADLVKIAKGLFYPERSYSAILDRAGRRGLAAAEIDALAAWLPAGRVNRKREDALAMLRRMHTATTASPGPKRVRFTFQHTEAWEELQRRCRGFPRRGTNSGLPAADTEGADSRPDALLEELRLRGDESYRRERERAMVRMFALEVARQQRGEVDHAVLEQSIDAFRRDRGLLEAEQIERWIEEQDLQPDEFLRLVEDEARIHRIHTLFASDLEEHLPQHLRVTGQYVRYAARARAKQRWLAARGLENPGLADTGLSEEELWRWYFEEHLGRPIPADLTSYALELDLADAAALRRAVVREYCFSQRERGGAGKGAPGD
ncbi:MAG: hypothetical protein GY856_34065 [bacterium]|nr:hypothetical protein [bacterium]